MNLYAGEGFARGPRTTRGSNGSAKIKKLWLAQEPPVSMFGGIRSIPRMRRGSCPLTLFPIRLPHRPGGASLPEQPESSLLPQALRFLILAFEGFPRDGVGER